MGVTFKDNSNAVLSAMAQAKKNSLTAIGMAAEGHAKDRLTKTVYTGDKKWKLTGRLRNSITFATVGHDGRTIRYELSSGKSHEETVKSNDKDSVYIGTNVGYAAGIETGSHRKAGAVHFLQHAATDFSDEYKRLAEDAMKNAR